MLLLQGSYSKVNPYQTLENTLFKSHLLLNHKVIRNQASLVPLITEIFTVNTRMAPGPHPQAMSGYRVQRRCDCLLRAMYVPGKYTWDCAPELKHQHTNHQHTKHNNLLRATGMGKKWQNWLPMKKTMHFKTFLLQNELQNRTCNT